MLVFLASIDALIVAPVGTGRIARTVPWRVAPAGARRISGTMTGRITETVTGMIAPACGGWVAPTASGRIAPNRLLVQDFYLDHRVFDGRYFD